MPMETPQCPAVTFDTLKFARRLKEAGVSDKHAEAEAEALAEVFQTGLGELATQRDIKELEAATQRDIKELELEIKGEIRLLKWMLGFMLAGIMGILLMLFRLFVVIPSS